MRTLYFDCFSGISGDMVIGALIDAGADPVQMEEELKKLNIDEEYNLSWGKVVKNGITSTKFDVILTSKSEQTHEHSHSHGHEHSHEHEHNHSHVLHHHHGSRTYKQIVEAINEANFNESVTNRSLAIFKKIGEAEGHIHGLPLEKVHFHEVGAVDSIIDIIGAAILIDQLGIESVQSSAIPTGSGHIHIDHGIYPVPAPATLEILKGVPIASNDIRFELTTPTGAAIAAVLAETFGSLPAMTVESIGYGAGTKTFENHPNVLRIIIGEIQ
ncbi:nickel pincer cofactor biosynthesis protein LarC [Peribacillus simplex]|uniref:TIGR00299 family protein n=1 Tax=Peribacillus simplex NBRC 15720 = DSM 1321 TaxID=1349754 RepID=A0A223ENM9_9BACI|nr:nickel pincer cofactor biosynthesis protein LarC [Peribacillus simplex]ASS96832.1 TIGR00299 family protein [Peribacillus simplex NBRC 15720 = DSM 1321]MEC1395744.1 nickel pincer cofactor biosynthesis protein LarC [Peribacillus simplex]